MYATMHGTGPLRRT